jgi:hypothetical protein
MKQLPERPAKKPYQSPKLLVYGDLAQMTKSKAIGGRADAAKSGLRRRTGA